MKVKLGDEVFVKELDGRIMRAIVQEFLTPGYVEITVGIRREGRNVADLFPTEQAAREGI